MEGFAGRAQERMGRASSDFALWSLRAISGLILGTTFALVAQEFMKRWSSDGSERFGIVSFTLVLVVVLGLFLRLSRNWTLTLLLVFDLAAVFLALLLRLYVTVAPNL